MPTPPLIAHDPTADPALPLLHLAVANGFPPATYTPFARALGDAYRVVTLPPRSLWPEAPAPPAQMLSWRQVVAADFIAGIQAHDLRDLVLVGHSFGGVASIPTALALPERVRALVLLDPPVLAPWRQAWMLARRAVGHESSWGLETSARRRRDRFESRDAAYENFSRKHVFSDWHPDALRAYADSMVPHPEGGVTLAWPSAWEAYFFRTWILYQRLWPDLLRLRRRMAAGGLPVLLIRGATSHTLLESAAGAMRAVLPQMAYEEVPGHGHLLVHSAPDETAARVKAWLAGV